MRKKYPILALVVAMLFLLPDCNRLCRADADREESAAGQRSLFEVAVGFVRYGELVGRSTITASSDTMPDLMWAEIMLQKFTGTDPTNNAHWTNQWATPEYRYENDGSGILMFVDYFDVIIGGTYRTKVTFYENNGGIVTSVGPVYSQAAGL